jgi:hypothetical protein
MVATLAAKTPHKLVVHEVDGDTYRCHVSLLPIHKEEYVDLAFVIRRAITGDKNIVAGNLYMQMVRRRCRGEIDDHVGTPR